MAKVSLQVLQKSFFASIKNMDASTVAFLLLFSVFGLLLYLFATKDDPFIPSHLIPKKGRTKSGIINWYAWRGPMFVEDFDGGSNGENFNDFGDIGYKPGNYSNGSPYETFDCVSEESHQDGIRGGSPLPQAHEAQSLSLALEGIEGFECPGLISDTRTCESTKEMNARKCKFLNNERQCHCETYQKCKGVKLSTSEDAYRNEYHTCSYQMRAPNPNTGDLGNYKQCTNNSLDAPNHLKFKSQGRWDYDITPPKHRVSKVCYKRNYDQCLKSKGHRTY